MPIFHVPVKTVSVEMFRVEATNAEEAMHLALENEDADYCTSIEITDGDPEVYYPDIIEVREP